MIKKRIENEQESAEVSQESRRDFLAKAGAFAVYTPPALLALMSPSVEAVASGGGGKKSKKVGKGKKRGKDKLSKRYKKRQLGKRSHS